MIIDPYEPPPHSADRALGAITEDEENVSEQQDREAAENEAKAKQNLLMDTDKGSGLTKADVDLLRTLCFCLIFWVDVIVFWVLNFSRSLINMWFVYFGTNKYFLIPQSI